MKVLSGATVSRGISAPHAGHFMPVALCVPLRFPLLQAWRITDASWQQTAALPEFNLPLWVMRERGGRSHTPMHAPFCGLVLAEDNDRKFGVRLRKDDLMTTIRHKRHAPFGVILSVAPENATRGTAPLAGRPDAAASI